MTEEMSPENKLERLAELAKSIEVDRVTHVGEGQHLRMPYKNYREMRKILGVADSRQESYSSSSGSVWEDGDF